MANTIIKTDKLKKKKTNKNVRRLEGSWWYWVETRLNNHIGVICHTPASSMAFLLIDFGDEYNANNPPNPSHIG